MFHRLIFMLQDRFYFKIINTNNITYLYLIIFLWVSWLRNEAYPLIL